MLSDPIDDFNYRERRYEQMMNNRPCCEICGKRIEDDEAYKIPKYGYICIKCMKESIEEL